MTARDTARLVRLDVRDFRNLERVELEPPPEGVVLIGENGQGKTNLLEAIYYLQILRSARGARDRDLIRFGAEAFHLQADVETDCARQVGVGFERAGKRKRVRLDGAIPERLSDALGALPSVMFSPDDVELVAGSPNVRRRFLDIMLALTTRGYLPALQRYRAALARRNAALRDAVRSNKTGSQVAAHAAVWEPALAEHGAVIWSARAAWVESVARRFEALCREIGESANVRMAYESAIEPGQDPVAALAGALEAKRGIDLKRGLTHAGPHRDDVCVTLDGRDLRTFGSAGQQRTAAIALRMLEAATFTERLGRRPVFLLDDPFAELDARRATRILEMLTRESGDQQIILAVPRESDIPSELTSLAKLRVANGRVGWFEGVT
ncbi:MAG TPA: DNA replication and repair protein RecF [Gemmatimonadaceae bacterium]|nr:DNA replication and repair protein RecF [Gemmatimonadaceae bacterium]